MNGMTEYVAGFSKAAARAGEKSERGNSDPRIKSACPEVSQGVKYNQCWIDWKVGPAQQSGGGTDVVLQPQTAIQFVFTRLRHISAILLNNSMACKQFVPSTEG
jgi:hypothetical protein